MKTNKLILSLILTGAQSILFCKPDKKMLVEISNIAKRTE